MAAVRASVLALVLAGLAAGLVACGGDDDGDSGAEPATSSIPPLASLEEPPPQGSSPVLKGVYRQFQPPESDPRVKGSRRAIRKGERTCRNKTPRQIRARFIAEADLSDDQRRAVSELPKHEKNPTSNFVAGQLGALVYEKTLPEDELASFGFQGCVYALSQRLKREMAPERGGRNSDGL